MMTAADLTRMLGGRWHGRYGTARCVIHDDRNPSLSIFEGDRGPTWKCFAGCDWRDIREELRRRRLLRPEPIEARQQPRIRFTGKPAPRDVHYEEQQHEKAAWLWSQRRRIEAMPAERYLREVRGYAGPIPNTFGFLPPRKPEHHPAMIAPYAFVEESEPGILAVPRIVDSVHLTLLRPDGSDKADIEHCKLTVGSPCGRPIVLAPPNDLLGLAITEGIEDALSAHEATGLGAWAAGSAPLMPALANAVPGYIEAVTIYAHDDSGKPYALELAEALDVRGIEVRVEGLAP
jgi:putative DNA primase/helicase